MLPRSALTAEPILMNKMAKKFVIMTRMTTYYLNFIKRFKLFLLLKKYIIVIKKRSLIKAFFFLKMQVNLLKN